MKKYFAIVGLGLLSTGSVRSQDVDTLNPQSKASYTRATFFTTPDSVINKKKSASIMFREKTKEEKDLKMGTGKINFTGNVPWSYDKYDGLKNIDQKKSLQKIDQGLTIPPPQPNFSSPPKFDVKPIAPPVPRGW